MRFMQGDSARFLEYVRPQDDDDDDLWLAPVKFDVGMLECCYSYSIERKNKKYSGMHKNVVFVIDGVFRARVDCTNKYKQI